MEKNSFIVIIWLVFSSLVFDKIISSSLTFRDDFSVELETDSEENDSESEEEKEFEKNYFFDFLANETLLLAEHKNQQESFSNHWNKTLDGYSSYQTPPPEK